MFIRLGRQSYARIRTSFYERFLRWTGWDFTRPVFFRCALTERCNYKCQYCSHWRQESYSNEMSLNEWKKAILSLKYFSSPLLLQFTGGEPFVWPHFVELVEFCHSIGVDWSFITNGSAFSSERTVRRIVAARPLKIDISVDGSTGDIHDRARGMDGSLARIERGIRLLVSERDRTGQRFAIRIKPTVHRLNVDNLRDIVDWSKKHGATSVDFSPVVLWRQEEIDNLRIGPEQIGMLRSQLREIVELKTNGQPIETSVERLKDIEAHFSGAERQYGLGECRAALRDFWIDPKGDVRGCACFETIGNIRKQTAKAIWKSKGAKKNRLDFLNCRVSSPAMPCTATRTIRADVRRGLMLFWRRPWSLR